MNGFMDVFNLELWSRIEDLDRNRSHRGGGSPCRQFSPLAHDSD